MSGGDGLHDPVSVSSSSPPPASTVGPLPSPTFSASPPPSPPAIRKPGDTAKFCSNSISLSHSRPEHRGDAERKIPTIKCFDATSGRHRSQIENASSDSAAVPSSKAQWTAESHDPLVYSPKCSSPRRRTPKFRRNGRNSQQSDFKEPHLKFQPFNEADSPKQSAAKKASEYPLISSELSADEVPKNHSAAGWKRRRSPDGTDEKPSTCACVTTSPNSAEECSFTMKPSVVKPFLQLLGGRKKLGSKNLIIFLTFVIGMLLVVHGHQLMRLKQENEMLKTASCRCSETGVASLDLKSSINGTSYKDAWKSPVIGGLAAVLCGLYLLLYYLSNSHSLKKLLRKSIDEDIPVSKHVAYLVDVMFSTHHYAKATALLFATLLLICPGGCSLYAVGDENLSDALWRSWTYIADSGNHADSVGLGLRMVSVIISIGGMLVFALMLGLVSDAISEKVDSLRKGKSEVIESGHTLILGWSDKLGSLLKQLAIANKSSGGGVVVVLAERDKEEMELDIEKLEFDHLGTSVICRSGSPLIMADLKKVSVSKARSVIVLAEVENADQSDARALRIVLSLTAVKEGLRGHIVVELSDLDNEPLVKLVGEDIVETVVAHDVIGRLMIQCARQPGLAQIWEDILGFDKAEFYLRRWPQLDGALFKDVLVSFPDAVPCGVKAAGDKGKIILNPDDNYVLRQGDEILVIAEDDNAYVPASPSEISCGSLPKVNVPPKLPEKILFCGWRRDIHDMIKILDAYLPSGSELWIFSDVDLEEREEKLEGNLDKLHNIKLEHRQGNPVMRRHLESLPLQTFHSILILADEKLEENVVIADSRSLATLLLIRDIQSKRLPNSPSKVGQLGHLGGAYCHWIGEMQQATAKSIIISEILDSRTKHLISVSKIGDYVLSNELVSMALAMVSEEKQINRVLEELFAEEGNELCMRSAKYYLSDQEELSFVQIMRRARQRHEIVVGYRKYLQERAIINPPNKAIPQKWSIADIFIILG